MSSVKAPAFTGILIVDSVPRGAAVLMNQKPLGVTPLRLPAQPAGSCDMGGTRRVRTLDGGRSRGSQHDDTREPDAAIQITTSRTSSLNS